MLPIYSGLCRLVGGPVAGTFTVLVRVSRHGRRGRDEFSILRGSAVKVVFSVAQWQREGRLENRVGGGGWMADTRLSRLSRLARLEITFGWQKQWDAA